MDTYDSDRSLLLGRNLGGWSSGTKPAGSHNGFGILHVTTHVGGYATQFGFDTNQNKIWVRSKNPTSWGSWKNMWTEQDFNQTAINNWTTAYNWGNHASQGYLTTVAWNDVTNKPTLDNYVSWNLKTNSVQRTTVGSGGDLNLVAGTNVSLAYSAGGTVTISSTDTNTNYYLNGISKSGNTLTFSVSGATNQSYTFGSNAFTSYSNHVGLYDSIGSAASEAGAVQDNLDSLSGSLGSAAYANTTAFAAASHSHSYLPLAGGTLTGDLTTSGNIKGANLQISSTTPTIYFNGTSDGGDYASSDMAIKATPEGLDFYEPEDGNKIHFQILDDAGVNAPYGYKWNGQSLDARYAAASHSHAYSSLTGIPSSFTPSAHTHSITDIDGLQTQLDGKQPTGNYITSLAGYATESYVTTAVSNLVDSAPTALNTLNELAAALGDDANFSTTISNTIATKLPLAGGTMTGDVTWTTTGRGLQWTMNTDGAYIRFYNTGDGDTNSRLEYATTDNGNEYHRFMVAGVERMAITAGGISATGYNKSNWDTAYSWGNHASAGYLTSVPAEFLTDGEGDARYLGINAKAADSNLLDGIDSSGFWRASGSWKPTSLNSMTRVIGITAESGSSNFAVATGGGKMYPYTDGIFYQNEGAYAVLDTNSGYTRSAADAAFAAASHSHSISDVSGLQTALNAKHTAGASEIIIGGYAIRHNTQNNRLEFVLL